MMATVTHSEAPWLRGLRGAAPAGVPQAGLSLERIAMYSAAVIGLLFVNKAGVPGNIVFFAILFVMVLHSPEAAFKALGIGLLGLVANQALVEKTVFWTPARLLLPIACFARFAFDLAALRYTLLRNGYYIALLAFLGVAAVLSIATQYCVPIALMKLFNFGIGSVAIFSGVQVVRLRKKDLAEWFVVLATITVVFGFMAILLGVGWNMRGAGVTTNPYFNGPFYHSNTLGPMAAMMVVYLVNVFLFGRYKNRWFCVVLAMCLLYFMLLAQSRTAFASMLIGVLATIGLTYVLTRRGLLRVRMNISRISQAGIVVALVLGIVIADAMTGGRLASAAVKFINKGGESESVDIEQAWSSREGVVAQLWENFRDSPVIGIGFEVAKTQSFQQNATILTAPIEKGFLPMAVLEETGIIGTFFFVIFLIALFRFLASSLDIPGIAMLVTFLAVNCGESMFFSFGGHGAFGWLWMAAGIMLGDFCIEQAHRSPLRPRP